MKNILNKSLKYSIINDMKKYEQFINENPKIKELDPTDIPEDLFISTMTTVCKLPVSFDTLMIATKLPLSDNLIQTVMCGKNGEICRTLTQIKKRTKKKYTKKKRNFYNQVTIIVNDGNNNKMNVKLFKNGSIQMTGCKKISSVIWGLSQLFEVLSNGVGDKHYAEPYIFLDIKNIRDFKIVMINSNFDIGIRINREKLFEILTRDKIECTYDSSRHAAVNIRYDNGNNKSSIFVFDKGSIIITGARTYRSIIDCYKFINIYIMNNFDVLCM